MKADFFFFAQILLGNFNTTTFPNDNFSNPHHLYHIGTKGLDP